MLVDRENLHYFDVDPREHDVVVVGFGGASDPLKGSGVTPAGGRRN